MEIPKKIKEAIKENKLVVFAGSGLSTKFNLPSWTKLVEDIIQEVDKEEYKGFLSLLQFKVMTPIEVLEKLKKEHNVIRRYILNTFNIKDVDFAFHKEIISLTSQIITTNYDNAFEIASNNVINPVVYTSTFNISEINKNNISYIFKLHGSYNEPDNCIIFKDDYEKLYSADSALKEKLKLIFTEKVILFLGFSFNGPDINLIFNNLDSVFGNNNKHFILTKEPNEFNKFEFLETLEIKDFNQIDNFISDCLTYKADKKLIGVENKTVIDKAKTDKPKIVALLPNPLDIDFKDDLSKVVNCFETLDASLLIGALNIKTLSVIEDYDILIIVSKVFKSNLYLEDDNLKSILLSPEEICSNITNEKIPIIFITNEKIGPVPGYSIISISSFKTSLINRFIYKCLKNNELNFIEEDISVFLTKVYGKPIQKGNAEVSSFYNNNKDLQIGKKSLENVIGRIEEQSIIALKLLNIKKTNKLLNIKASGGTGKTTLIKKVAYELYNRGYFKEGVIFKSCESVKTFEDFEEVLIDGFNLTNILNFKEYLKDNYSFLKRDLLVIPDNFETVVNSVNKVDLNKVIDLLKFSTDFANVVITSRERLSPDEDYEDVYSLTPLITDDALTLFEKYYGSVNNVEERRILRTDILEDLLNNNPLAIKLVTMSRTRFKFITELKAQLIEHFFESINEDYSLVFKNNADLNIERTKSIYQSINYSYTTLNTKERLAFELLNLFRMEYLYQILKNALPQIHHQIILAIKN